MHLTPFGAVDAFAFRMPLRVPELDFSSSAVACRKSKFMTIFFFCAFLNILLGAMCAYCCSMLAYPGNCEEYIWVYWIICMQQLIEDVANGIMYK